jgi:HAD superfamily hydrolase (TIGR01484 family)
MFKSLKCFKIYQNTNLNSFKIILVCAFPKRIKEFTKVLDTEFKDKVSYINTNPYLIEINAITTSKASAARYILEKAGLTSADAAAFGDSPNDIPMFKEVSLPISIRTNKEKIIKATKYHIPKFRNGVSKAINKYILE